MGLIDALDKKQALKFQLNGFGEQERKFIKQTLLNNNEGIFNLSSDIDNEEQNKILNYLQDNYKNYNFESESKFIKFINPKIYFKKSS